MSKLLVSPQIARGFYPGAQNVRGDRNSMPLSSNIAGNAARPLVIRYSRFAEIVPRIQFTCPGLFPNRAIKPSGRRQTRCGARCDRRACVSRAAAKAFALVREVAGQETRHAPLRCAAYRRLCAAEGHGGGDGNRGREDPDGDAAACTAALAGIPVHVITVNDYLARRDGESMRPVYRDTRPHRWHRYARHEPRGPPRRLPVRRHLLHEQGRRL